MCPAPAWGSWDTCSGPVSPGSSARTDPRHQTLVSNLMHSRPVKLKDYGRILFSSANLLHRRFDNFSGLPKLRLAKVWFHRLLPSRWRRPSRTAVLPLLFSTPPSSLLTTTWVSCPSSASSSAPPAPSCSSCSGCTGRQPGAGLDWASHLSSSKNHSQTTRRDVHIQNIFTRVSSARIKK